MELLLTKVNLKYDSMTQKLTAKIIKPSGVEHELEADMVIMPGSEGEFGVMYDHVPMIVQLKAGSVKIHNGEDVKTVQIGQGVAVVTGTSVEVVCDS